MSQATRIREEHCLVCRWSRQCDSRRRRDDHLCLVAGISGRQMEELKGRGVATTSTLAAMPMPLLWKPERGAAVSYERVREQARVQIEGRETGRPVYEALAPEPRSRPRTPAPAVARRHLLRLRRRPIRRVLAASNTSSATLR